MLVDSDDIVSNRIAEYVNSHPNQNGFLSDYGYIYNDGAAYVKKTLALYRICGSCAIVNYSVDDLPDTMPRDLWDDTPKDKWIIRKSHRIIPKYLEDHGRKLAKIPFPTTIYVRQTGDNHSMLGDIDLNIKRKMELMFRPRVKLNGKIGLEFGFK